MGTRLPDKTQSGSVRRPLVLDNSLPSNKCVHSLPFHNGGPARFYWFELDCWPQLVGAEEWTYKARNLR
jgi:hypothetical protein